MLIKKSCEKSWRGAERTLVQPRIVATMTGPHGKKHRRFQKDCCLRNCDVSLLTVHPPDVCCRFGVSLKNQQKARNMCKPLINYVCSVILEQLEKKKMFFLGATPNLANVRRSDGKSNLLGQEREVMGEPLLRKPGFVFVLPSVMEQNVKWKREMDLEELPKTASLERVTSLMHELKQQDVRVATLSVRRVSPYLVSISSNHNIQLKPCSCRGVAECGDPPVQYSSESVSDKCSNWGAIRLRPSAKRIPQNFKCLIMVR